MFHDFIRQIQAVRVFDQSPARLATRSIPSHDDVILEVRDDAGSSVTSLDRDGFKEQIHGVGEPLLRSWGAFGYEAGPVTKPVIERLSALIRGRREMQTFSSISRRESWDHRCGVGSKWS